MDVGLKDSRNYSRLRLILNQAKEHQNLSGLEMDVVDYYSSFYVVSGFRSPDLKGKGCWLDRRYVLQFAVSELLPGSRPASCGKTPIMSSKKAVAEGKKVSVDQTALSLPKIVKRKNREGKDYLSYEGLSRCGSVWVCPHCSSKISEVRRREMEKAVRQWRGDRYGVDRNSPDYFDRSGFELRMVLLTVPHQPFDALDSLLDRFKEAFRWMTSHCSYKRLFKKCNLIGTISVLEVTYGLYGWHPHYHILYFFEQSRLDDDYFAAELFSIWQNSVNKFGFGDLSLGGFGVKDADFVSDYLTKFGRSPKSDWRVEHEMSKWHLKKSRDRQSLTPFDLLELYAAERFYSWLGWDNLCNDSGFDFASFFEDHDGLHKYFVDLVPGERFVEYSKAFKGRHQIRWSPDLKKRFSIQELTDQEVLNDGDGIEVLYDIPLSDWDKLISNGNRYDFLLRVKSHFGID